MTYILFHDQCADGYTAAWATWRKLGDVSEYIPVQYGQPPLSLAPAARAYIVDCSYPRQTMLALQARHGAENITVLDHHKTAEAELKDLPGPIVFNMNKSGAAIAWQHFHPAFQSSPNRETRCNFPRMERPRRIQPLHNPDPATARRMLANHVGHAPGRPVCIRYGYDTTSRDRSGKPCQEPPKYATLSVHAPARRNLEEDMSDFYAHSANSDGQWHRLTDHLRAVAEMASHFCDSFGSASPAYYAGLWHDLGKFNPDFQRYLAGERTGRLDHKGTGAQLAYEHRTPIGLLIQGHHGGLRQWVDFNGWIKEKGSAASAVESLDRARQVMHELEPPSDEPLSKSMPGFVKDRLGLEMWLRMVFSALVDADFLDTERHFNPDRSATRDTAADIAMLWERFQRRHAERIAEPAGTVNLVRYDVYQSCLSAAERPPGIFRLAVPTGGGKTLSGMGFALRHASVNNMQRVIVAVPFISITQQTAQAYRDFLEGAGGDRVSAVLEHHSAVEPDDHDDYHHDSIYTRLASENWDAPVVVTTTVQLFQSLFSNRISSVRKLHNLANSVVVLDEAQALPLRLLTPILYGLKDLTDNYRVTAVLSTATQPAFEAIKSFADADAVDIVPSYREHFQTLRRVSYEWRTDPAVSWAEVADLMRETSQALAIVNTRQDALSLVDAMDRDVLHLSTHLCGRHRDDVIEEIHRRLDAGEECRVVSTQVVEAGVDLDFPMALRAMGPLDSIIQAAGRCNREGKMAEPGRVIVFEPAEAASLPGGGYRQATDIARALLKENNGALEPDDLTTLRDYFQRLYDSVETDQKVQSARESMDYPETARRFRMIEDDSVSAVVTEYGSVDERRKVHDAMATLRKGSPDARRMLRTLQPWLVQVRRQRVPEMLSAGTIAEVMPGLYEWTTGYDPVTGIGAAA